ncbi:MAG: hydroxylase [Alphaproteobacteria bacterium]|nr:hydroxylase [Alphaproteobacteria bacterium]
MRLLLVLGATIAALAITHPATAQDDAPAGPPGASIYYLEIVTSDVEATCAALAAQHGVSFTEPQPELGGARTTTLDNGGRIGVRGPLSDQEQPIVRPYMRVDDIAAAIAAAESAGAEVAMNATEIAGQGEFAIYILGGVQHAVWEP